MVRFSIVNGRGPTNFERSYFAKRNEKEIPIALKIKASQAESEAVHSLIPRKRAREYYFSS
jgi:hypothetical protein